MHKWFIAISIIALVPCSLRGQETELKSTKAKAAVREYERKVEDVDKEFEKQLKDLEKSYQMKAELIRARLITNLNEAMEEEARKINLEEANKIKAAMDEAKKYEAPTLEGLLDPSIKVRVQIPKDAVEFKGHHYALSKKSMPVYYARRYAESLGGHVVRIDSVEEEAFCVDLMIKGNMRSTWMDLCDGLQEDNWINSNGEKVKYFHWRSGEPNDKDRTNHAVQMGSHDRAWGDSPSDKPNTFVIEWDK